MIANNGDIYFRIHDYIYKLVNDKDISLRLVDVFTKTEIPLQTFITAAKLYGIILNRANAVDENQACSKPIKSRRSDKSNQVGEMSARLIRQPYITFISCCVISSKYYKDIAFNNESWGNVSCLDKFQINEFERLILNALDYKINTAGDGNIMADVQLFLRRSEFGPNEAASENFDVKHFIKKMFCFS